MNLAEYSIKKKTITLVITVLLVVGGVLSFGSIGKLEDPEFIIKDAVVITAYPGASPQEVEEEVTDRIETAIQQLGQLKEIKSISRAGVSVITVSIKDKYDKDGLPQVWDELRRKVGDVQSQLPPGVQTSVVNDDFGDVYGILLAITGDGYTYKELKDAVDYLRKELLLVKDVSKISIWGVQNEAVFVEISTAKMAQLGLGLDTIYSSLQSQNLVVPAGSVKVGPEYIRISPTGGYQSIDNIKELQIRDPQSNKVIYLKDIANVYRGYVEPPSQVLHYNGTPAISIGVSIASGGNVVNLGKAVTKRLDELEAMLPVGMELGVINFQATDVTNSITAFVINFLEAIGIVIVILLIFMGLRSGLLIGAILTITVLGTIIVMEMVGISLERISLGALIIALGMLVDNAIVVTEGMLIRIQAGMDRLKAAGEVVTQTQMPLLGATVIAVLAFWGIGMSQDSTGEFCRSLFQVMLISLMMSWVIAITITPLFCKMFLKGGGDGSGEQEDPYKGIIFVTYKKMLSLCIRVRWVTILVCIAMLVASIYGFGLLKGSFFPASTKPMFLVHYWLPSGTDIRRTTDDISTLEKYILKDERVTSVASYIGDGAPRFILTFSPEETSDNGYGLLLVTVNSYEDIDTLIPEIETHINESYPDAYPVLRKFALGPGSDYDIEARFSGPDAAVLRDLAEQAKTIMRDYEYSARVWDDWRPPVKKIQPIFDEVKAKQAGISRPMLSQALETSFSGTTVGVYREGDDILPIISRLPDEERLNVGNLDDIQIYSPYLNTTIPISQVVSGYETVAEDSLRMRFNRKLTIRARGNIEFGMLPSEMQAAIENKIEAIQLPAGYELQWGAEKEDSAKAQAGIKANMAAPTLAMIIIIIMLFNNLKQPAIILLTVPFAIIGVAVGLLSSGVPFGFMSLLGMLSLTGMLIKNAIVLIDQINIERDEGREPLDAVMVAAVSRMRPVCMAAITTVLGMLPLVVDPFFQGMAVTVMGGLTFATALTLILVPVLYAIFYNVKWQKT
jgi:multidrug efflux pump subunit AcrB